MKTLEKSDAFPEFEAAAPNHEIAKKKCLVTLLMYYYVVPTPTLLISKTTILVAKDVYIRPISNSFLRIRHMYSKVVRRRTSVGRTGNPAGDVLIISKNGGTKLCSYC